MGKNAVIPFNWQDFLSKLRLKRPALLFDKIYVSDLDIKIKMGRGLSMPNNLMAEELIKENLATIDYLIENGIINTYTQKFVSEIEAHEAQPLINKAKGLDKSMNEIITNEPVFLDVNDFSRLVHIQKELFGLRIRIDAIELTNKINEDVFPILKTVGMVSEENRKTQIANFVLENIPEPDESTSWEQIIEFRKDPEVRNKYLALINWINKVAASQSSLIDIKDEYEFLYNDYIKHFNLHKMKYNNGMLEVVVTVGAGLLTAFHSGHFATPFKNLLKMQLSYVNLLQEEAKLPGKEVAYIYKVNQSFL